jgi:hypothetical protein
MLRCTVLAVALGAFVVPFDACGRGAYRWTDEAGTVHFGDRPPAGADQVERLVLPGPVPADPQAEGRRDRRDRLLEAWGRERADIEAAAERREAVREQRRIRCERARREVTGLETAGRIYVREADGARSYLDDAARRDAIGAARGRVEEYCD